MRGPSRDACDLAVRTPLSAWRIDALMRAENATAAEVERAIELAQAYNGSVSAELHRIMGKAATR